jgi:hypothetical protein
LRPNLRNTTPASQSRQWTHSASSSNTRNNLTSPNRASLARAHPLASELSPPP